MRSLTFARLGPLAAAGLIASGAIASDPVRAGPATSPPSIAPPRTTPTEDFGLGTFPLSAAKLEAGEATTILAPDQARLWVALLALVKSTDAFHSKSEVEQAVGLRLSLEIAPKLWKTPAGSIEVIYAGIENDRAQGSSIMIAINLTSGLQVPYCISAIRALADLQRIAGAPYMQLGNYRRFRMPGRRYKEIGVKSDILEAGCLKYFIFQSLE